jgi:hypothetical protein
LIPCETHRDLQDRFDRDQQISRPHLETTSLPHSPTLETRMDDFLVQALPIMVDSWAEILKLLRALAKLFGW